MVQNVHNPTRQHRMRPVRIFCLRLNVVQCRQHNFISFGGSVVNARQILSKCDNAKPRIAEVLNQIGRSLKFLATVAYNTMSILRISADLS